jgi:hypothetical protein
MHGISRLLALLGPSGMVLLNELHAFPYFGTTMESDQIIRWVLILANYAVYGFITWRIRARCLKHADRYLGRREESPNNRPPTQISKPRNEMNKPEDLVIS